MTHRLRTGALVLTASAAAASAPTAAAHTSVYTSQTKTATVGTPGNPSVLADGPIDYLVSNHGHNVVLRETNGLTSGGALNYKVLPSNWRKEQSKATLLATATGAQVHATCQTPLLDEAAVLAWQESDPFYAYVPWQAQASGLGDADEVAGWIAVVKARTGIDLATVADPAAACAGIGGTYVRADSTQTTGAALASGDIALVADPLKKQIEDFKGQLAAAAAGKAAVDAAKASADAALRAAASPVTVKLAGTATRAALAGAGVQAEVTGSPAAPIEVLLTVTPKLQASKGLPTRTLATAGVRLDAGGKGTVTLKASAKTAKALARVKGGLAVAVTARVNVSATAATTLGA